MKPILSLFLFAVLIATLSNACSGGSGGTPTKDDLVAIKEPASLTVANLNTTSFTLKWSSVDTATKYFVDISVSQDFSTLVPAFSNKNVGDVTTLEVADVEAGVTYYCRVRAANGRVTGKNSTVVSAATLAIINSFPGRP